MGIKNLVFNDNSPPQCDAQFLNTVRSETNNIITNSGQTPVTSNLNQLGIATSIYAAGADFYTDTGAADAYALSGVGSKQTPNAYFTGMRIRFIVGNTNTGASTVNVASLGVKDIKGRDGSSDPTAGDFLAGQIIELTYDGTNFVVSNGVPFAASIFPVGSFLNYAGTTAPTDWLLCHGQAVSRATYANLFGVIGTAYGSGDGSTTFNLPDYRGRTFVGLDNMGGSSANRITNANADSLNNTGGGSENTTPVGTVGTSGATSITTAQMPSHTHSQNAMGSGGGGVLPTASRTDFTGQNDASYQTASTGSGNSHTHTGGTFTGTSGDTTQPWLASAVIIKF
jgi:microcystin-dependent protein